MQSYYQSDGKMPDGAIANEFALNSLSRGILRAAKSCNLGCTLARHNQKEILMALRLDDSRIS
jgi:hypothetical protein